MTDKNTPAKPVDIAKCPTAATATIFGCSAQHLRNLTAKGAIKQTARGKYDLAEVAAYMMQANEADMAPIQKAKLDTELEKARRQKRLNDEEAGKLVPVEAVREFAYGYTGELVQMLESIKKTSTALIPASQRPAFNEKFDHARTQLAKRFKTFTSDTVSDT